MLEEFAEFFCLETWRRRKNTGLILHFGTKNGQPAEKQKEVDSMTMVKRESNSVWNLVREDRDIDDLIFAGETLNGREMAQPCSDR